MNRVFSNGPLRDFVINPFTDMLHKSTRLYVAAPFVTETGDLLIAAKGGTSVDLLVGLNMADVAARNLQRDTESMVG